MHGQLWWQLLWFCQASCAVRYVVDKPDDAPARLTCTNMAVILAVVLMLVLGMKWVWKKIPLEGADKTKEESLSNEGDLESRLLQALSHREQELVKLVTLVRSHKAKLSARHRGCKVPECQRDRSGGNVKAFNLAVYDIAEENPEGN